MYDVIQMTMPPYKLYQESAEFYMEAVFKDGKETVTPILEAVQACKNLLTQKLQEVQDSIDANKKDKNVKIKEFDPKAYWRDPVWRTLEDSITKTFGFRYCEINPYIEKYMPSVNKFESKELNCTVYHADRYPIEGLVTDKGYYDKTHSSVMTIYVTLGLVKELDADEILAVLLHEFGHSIDPALTSITYSGTNILTKYITDRKGSLTKAEKKVEEKHNFIIVILLLLYLGSIGISLLWDNIRAIILGKEKIEQEQIDKICDAVNKDKKMFKRQEYSEAFADNFARMYGYGAVLARALSKLSKSIEADINSWSKKEHHRQALIMRITLDAINDCHKTDIHRVRALIREYKKDIEDPATPAPVKKALQQDLDELEKVLDLYLNNFSDFQNKVNKAINDELIKKEKKEDSKNKKPESK